MLWLVLIAPLGLLWFLILWPSLRNRRGAMADRRRLADVHQRPSVWKCQRVGGGGVFDTPPLLRTDAFDYVTRRGTHQIVYVDDVHKFIFYRSL